MISKTDSEGRVALPSAEPGEVYDVQHQGEGRYLLVRLEKASPEPMSRQDCLQAIQDHPLQPTMSWEELRSFTREP